MPSGRGIGNGADGCIGYFVCGAAAQGSAAAPVPAYQICRQACHRDRTTPPFSGERNRLGPKPKAPSTGVAATTTGSKSASAAPCRHASSRPFGRCEVAASQLRSIV